MTMNNKTVEVGETLHWQNVGDASGDAERSLEPVKVTEVGGEYFTCASRHREVQFSREDWKQKTSGAEEFVLYPSENDYLDELESRKLCSEIAEAFACERRQNNVPLGSLRVIRDLINAQGDPSELNLPMSLPLRVVSDFCDGTDAHVVDAVGNDVVCTST